MKIAAVVNMRAKRARDRSVQEELKRFFREQGIAAEVHFCRSHHLEQVFRDAIHSKPDALVAGGGDGTISQAAELCIQNGIPLGVLMLGTRNHFGRDLSLPDDLEEAVKVVARQKTARIDVGSVNGHFFINNSSIGAYPRAVDEREKLREQFGLRKYVAGVIATLRVFARRPVLIPSLELDGQTVKTATPFVFIGNNRYHVDFFSVRLRDSLTEGLLCVYTARCGGLSGFFKLLWLALRSSLDQSRDFEMRFCSALGIHLKQKAIRVSKDGEVLRLTTPLQYQIHPKALEVFVP